MSRPRPVMTSWWPHDDLWPLELSVSSDLRPELLPPTEPGQPRVIQMISDPVFVTVSHPFLRLLWEEPLHWMGLIASLSIFWTIAPWQSSRPHFPQLSPTLTGTAAICIEHKRSAPVWVWIVIPPNARWPYTSGDGLSLSRPRLTPGPPSLCIQHRRRGLAPSYHAWSLIETFIQQSMFVVWCWASKSRRCIRLVTFFHLCLKLNTL